ncbi:MAG: hypothetical protein ACRECR_06275, partial [Thermoplasmata archaeon]
VLLGIVYLGSVFPNNSPGLAFSITGYGGTSANLPPGGPTNHSLLIEAIVQNNATAQSFTLAVRAATVGSSPPGYRSVAWADPLVLGNGTSASDLVNLGSSQAATVDVQFEFLQPGKYLLQFLLESASGTLLGTATWPVAIS